MLNLQADILNLVVIQAKQSAAAHPRWLNAIERAAVELESNPWIEAQDDHTLLIGSPSGQTYIGNGSCQCAAYAHGIPCWHRAAARLYHRYVEMEAKSALVECSQPDNGCSIDEPCTAHIPQAIAYLAPLGDRLAKARREMAELFS